MKDFMGPKTRLQPAGAGQMQVQMQGLLGLMVAARVLAPGQMRGLLARVLGGHQTLRLRKQALHLLPTPLSRQARKYIVDMEGRSGLAIPGEQRQLLNQALKNRKFEKLPAAEKIAHTKEYQKQRESLISQWEQNTGAKMASLQL